MNHIEDINYTSPIESLYSSSEEENAPLIEDIEAIRGRSFKNEITCGSFIAVLCGSFCCVAPGIGFFTSAKISATNLLVGEILTGTGGAVVFSGICLGGIAEMCDSYRNNQGLF